MTIKGRLRNAWKSLTIWCNLAFANLMLLLPVAQDSFPALREYIPADIYQVMMGVVVAANIALRFKTTTDLKDK